MPTYHKQESLGAFAKKGEDINDGDIIILMDGGVQTPNRYNSEKMQNVFLVKLTNGEEKHINVNQTSLNNLVESYGEEGNEWVGKKAKVWINRENVAGKFVLVLYLTHPDKQLGESDIDTDEINAELA